MTIEEAVIAFENQLHSAVAMLDSGFGTHPGENDSIYSDRKEIAEMLFATLRDRKEMAEIALAALRAQQEREAPKPLTLEELREMDDPVWCLCKTIEGGNGYWCLCPKGLIITPAGISYHIDEIPHWVFLRHKLKEESKC